MIIVTFPRYPRSNGALVRGSTPGPTYPRDGASAPTATVRPRYIPPTAAVGTNLNRAEPAPAEALQFPEQAVPSEGHQLAKKRQTRRGGMRQRGGAQAPGNDQEEELPCGGTSASEQVAHRIAPPGTATSRELLRATDEEGEREMQFRFAFFGRHGRAPTDSEVEVWLRHAMNPIVSATSSEITFDGDQLPRGHSRIIHTLSKAFGLRLWTHHPDLSRYECFGPDGFGIKILNTGLGPIKLTRAWATFLASGPNRHRPIDMLEHCGSVLRCPELASSEALFQINLQDGTPGSSTLPLLVGDNSLSVPYQDPDGSCLVEGLFPQTRPPPH